MAIPISSKVNNIQSASEGFTLQTAAFLVKIQGRQISTPEVETHHQKIIQVFGQSMQEISELKKEINSKMTPGNEEEMISFVERVTQVETDVLEGLKRLNDILLTNYPAAKIFYGDIPCIGPKIAPHITTSNKKILETVSKASAIREIRGDGNCFISALTTRFFENLVQTKAIDQFINFIAEDGSDAVELKTELILTLSYLQDYPSQFENVLKNNQKILPFINYFRHLAAQEMKENKGSYDVFFLAEIEQVYGESIENKTYEHLVDKYVLAMGVDFSHPMITALCKKLDFAVRIIDPKIGASEGLLILDKPEANATFCRNDQHYFVLYTPEEAAAVLPEPQQPKPVERIVEQTPPPQTSSITAKHPYDGKNRLFIRGGGPGMNWEKGIALEYVGNDTWTFSTQTNFEEFDYKFLLNDERWENTLNHKLEHGKKEEIKNLEFQPKPAERIVERTPPPQTSSIIAKHPYDGKNRLFIRGGGPGMNWEKGIALEYVGNDTWTFSTQTNFEEFDYKFLLNDERWENALNHKLEHGKKEEIKNLEFQ
jgi:hypothetical protein